MIASTIVRASANGLLARPARVGSIGAISSHWASESIRCRDMRFRVSAGPWLHCQTRPSPASRVAAASVPRLFPTTRSVPIGQELDASGALSSLHLDNVFLV